MYERFWRTYEQVVFTYFYYLHYRNRANTRDSIVNGIFLITSSASIANLAIWKYLTWVWATILLISQITAAIKPLLPYSKQIIAIDYMLNELNDLRNEVDKEWQLINFKDEWETENVISKICEFDNKLSRLQQKYIGSKCLYRNNICRKKAAKEQYDFLNQKYDIKIQEKIEVKV